MKMLSSLEEWIDIYNMFKYKNHHIETNCYKSLHELENYILSRRLGYQQISDTSLWLYQKERGYIIAYYYAKKGTCIELTRQEEDMIIYLIGNEKKYPFEREKQLLEFGFGKYRRNRQYIVTIDQVEYLKEINERTKKFFERKGFVYSYITSSNYEEVFQLWRKRIDRYSVNDLTNKQLGGLVRGQTGICIIDPNGEIGAAGDFFINGAIGNSENIAVRKKYNGLGLGAAALCSSLVEIFSRGCKKGFIWVCDENMESIRMTTKFASATEMYSQQLLLRSRGQTDADKRIGVDGQDSTANAKQNSFDR